MEELIAKIEMDIKVNERCLEEETSLYITKLLQMWIQYDRELLKIIKEIK